MTVQPTKKSLALAVASLFLVSMAAGAAEATKPKVTGPAAAATEAAETMPPGEEATVGTSPAGAAGAATKKPMTPQQMKMSTCSKDAKDQGLKGPDRKGFMRTCLKKK